MRGSGKLCRDAQGQEGKGQGRHLRSQPRAQPHLLRGSAVSDRAQPALTGDQGGGEEVPDKGSWRMEKWIETPLTPLTLWLVPHTMHTVS